jgi:hypothetical protein
MPSLLIVEFHSSITPLSFESEPSQAIAITVATTNIRMLAATPNTARHRLRGVATGASSGVLKASLTKNWFSQWSQ